VKSHQHLQWHLLPAAFLILSAAIFTCAQTAKTNSRPETPNAPPTTEDRASGGDSATYSYEFTQPQFYLRHIVIEHDSSGRGRVTFERLNEDVPIVENLQLSPTVLNRIRGLFAALGFLDSQANYQSDKQFPHLGTVRITLAEGTRKRTVEFNWSSDKDAASLASEYRKIADQANFVFDMSVARENQPLNAPKLMESLESLMRRDAIADPQQLIPLLKEISTDEHLPLIARNHALRLIKKIEKQ
jgi:hypothetical protein